jgi:hypothetical protein
MEQISRHYLQSDEWKKLRSAYRGETGFDEPLSSAPSLRLLGHIARERRRRSIFYNRVLESFHGPYHEGTDSVEILPKDIVSRIQKIGLHFNADVIRIHGYLSRLNGYHSIDEYIFLLSNSEIPFKYTKTWTSIYKLELHTIANLTQSDSTMRKNLRKASNIEVIRAENSEQIEEFLLNNASIKNHAKPKPYEIQAYREFNRDCTFFMAFDKDAGKCVGTLGFVHDNTSAMEMMSSTAKGAGARGVQEKLHLACFDEAKNLGLKFFDLAGLEKAPDGSWNSIARFKLKFGGEIVEAGFVEF